jgi:hypothetical protein
MSNHFLTVIVACVGVIFVSSAALARPVTTDDCLAKGLCAYVSPTGRVTCGKCPGQVQSVQTWVAVQPNCVWRRGIFGRTRLVCP